MPIYEYRCHQCRRRVSIWWRTFSEAEQGTARCPRCGSENLSRMVSRVRLVRSEESRLDDLSQFGDLDENDPRSLGRWMRRMSQEIGEDLGPEFDEVVDRLEAGQSPEEIEKALPDLAGPESGAEDDSYLD